MDNSDRHNCNHCLWADQCAGDSPWPCEDFSPIDDDDSNQSYYITIVKDDIDEYFAAIAEDE